MTVSNNKELLLEVNHLGVSFKIKNDKSLFFAKPQTLKAVKDVSFKLYEGETLGVVGESGCGKSTLARAIIGLVEASEGEILWLGKNLRKQSAKQWKDTRKDIQMIFQDPLASLNPRMNIGEIIESVTEDESKIFTRVPGLGIKKAQKIILDLKDKVKKLDLTETIEEISDISSGKLITSNTSNPKLLLMKEDLKLALESLGYINSDVSKWITDKELVQVKDISEAIKMILQKIQK